jgi:hypothetical protein
MSSSQFGIRAMNRGLTLSRRPDRRRVAGGRLGGVGKETLKRLFRCISLAADQDRFELDASNASLNPAKYRC